MSEIKATVILPTTGDRGPLLPYSVGSIQNQTVKDIEIFIIGDGVDDNTRKVIFELKDKDRRIRFFDHPKDISRGERYRHAALQCASGRLVCYLLDRDFMLPHHIENLMGYIEKYNLVTSRIYNIGENFTRIPIKLVGEPDDKFLNQVKALREINDVQYSVDEFTKESYNKVKKSFKVTVFGLSCLSHTLDFYNSLPYGWRTTPPGYFTDQYMELQMYLANNCKPYFNISPPSILYFKRGHHPGWPVEKRIELLKYWQGLVQNGKYKDRLERSIFITGIKDFISSIKKRNKKRVLKILKKLYLFFNRSNS